jgi:hypothetical protein
METSMARKRDSESAEVVMEPVDAAVPGEKMSRKAYEREM